MAKKSKKTMKRAKTTKKATKSAKAATKKVAPIPPGYHTVTPYLVCREAARAIEFYKKAFGAKDRYRMLGPDGKIAHAELNIGNSIVMLGDEAPQFGATAPPTVGGTSTGLFIYSVNVDKAYAQAIAAGATSEMPPMDMFWGDRYAKLIDPFGHKWQIATHIEDVSPKEMKRRGDEEFAKQAAAAS
jgi:PhnB protein